LNFLELAGNLRRPMPSAFSRAISAGSMLGGRALQRATGGAANLAPRRLNAGRRVSKLLAVAVPAAHVNRGAVTTRFLWNKRGPGTV